MGASILAKEYRCEAPGIPATELVWRETAKMGPSSTSCTSICVVELQIVSAFV